MVKIIEPGKKMYRKRCCYCQCLFSFEEEDIEKHEICDRGTSYGFNLVIKCPFCKNELHTDYRDVIRYPEGKKEYEFPPQTVEAISGVSPV